MAEQTQSMTPAIAKERYAFLKDSGVLDANITKFALGTGLVSKGNFDDIALIISTFADSAVDPGEPVEILNAKAAFYLAAHEFRQTAERLAKLVGDSKTCNCDACRAERAAKGGANG